MLSYMDASRVASELLKFWLGGTTAVLYPACMCSPGEARCWPGWSFAGSGLISIGGLCLRWPLTTFRLTRPAVRPLRH